ncbi:lactoylglutathione lyase [Zafaria cholistanensis]|uniref:Lactoylglutathione lyase n=1 Tax=Zafaria cholistanensis TaxID=1682741 RepID=A0A5A7NUZ6_9MICC|nr:VOC family protein [Zafaria cholistanensis]GER23808.1 lactoylglutathione lyase [Zafaria cholistanensis]
MGRMIFVNLPTQDLSAADRFYAALGFEKNTDFSGRNATAWRIAPDIWVMSLADGFYRTFLRNDDAPGYGQGVRETLNTISCASVAEVDGLTRQAEAGGGTVYRAPEEVMPGMYASAVADPDGHVWELVWMGSPDGDAKVPTGESGE